MWVESRCRALRDEAGALLGVQTSARDISDRKHAETAQRVSDEMFRTAFDEAPIGMALVSPDGRWLRVNDAICEITGYECEALLRRTFQDITHPADLDADVELVEKVLAGELQSYQMEKRYIRADRRIVWVLLAASLVRDEEGNPLHFIAQVKDISEHKDLESELRGLADRDPLSGLWNRRHLARALTQQVGRCQRNNETAALLVIDLDGFKEVNDTLGHQTGDELLKEIAKLLVKQLRESDTIARIGGDEFAILLPHTTSDRAARVAGKLEKALAVRLSGVTIRASIGTASVSGWRNATLRLLRQTVPCTASSRCTVTAPALARPLSPALRTRCWTEDNH